MSKFFLRILNIAVFFYLIIQTNSFAGATFVSTINNNPVDYMATGIGFNKDGTQLILGIIIATLIFIVFKDNFLNLLLWKK